MMDRRPLSDYYSVMPWEWYQLRSARCLDLVPAVAKAAPLYGRPFGGFAIGGDPKGVVTPAPGVIEETDEKISPEQLRALVSFAENYGAAIWSLYLFAEFQAAYDQLFERYDLSRDGVVPIEKDRAFVMHADIAMSFDNIIVTGHGYVAGVEGVLPGNSSVLKRWKAQTSRMFDRDLAYAFCERCRNCIEHGIMLVSVVNWNEHRNQAGLAINLDAGILDKEGVRGEVIRKRLLEFRDGRLRQGKQPWLSVASVLRQWKSCLCELQLYLLSLLSDSLQENLLPGTCANLVERYDCLVWHCAGTAANDKGDLTYPIDRLYDFPPADYTSLLQDAAHGILEWSDLSGEAHDSLRRGICSWSDC